MWEKLKSWMFLFPSANIKQSTKHFWAVSQCFQQLVVMTYQPATSFQLPLASTLAKLLETIGQNILLSAVFALPRCLRKNPRFFYAFWKINPPKWPKAAISNTFKRFFFVPTPPLSLMRQLGTPKGHHFHQSFFGITDPQTEGSERRSGSSLRTAAEVLRPWAIGFGFGGSLVFF